jgi:hypothetical protein
MMPNRETNKVVHVEQLWNDIINSCENSYYSAALYKLKGSCRDIEHFNNELHLVGEQLECPSSPIIKCLIFGDDSKRCFYICNPSDLRTLNQIKQNLYYNQKANPELRIFATCPIEKGWIKQIKINYDGGSASNKRRRIDSTEEAHFQACWEEKKGKLHTAAGVCSYFGVRRPHSTRPHSTKHDDYNLRKFEFDLNDGWKAITNDSKGA